MAKKDKKEKGIKTTVYLGIVNGKQKTKTVRGKTQREVNAKIAKIKEENRQGKDVLTKAVFDVWADKWLTEIKIPKGISNKTIEEYQGAIKHLDKEYGKTELKNIKLADFQSFINELANENPNTGKPASKKLLKDIIATAKGIFKYAIANDIAGVTDFFDSVVIPKIATVEKRRALSEEEQKWIIETKHRAQLPAMIMMFAGLRRGEVIPLTCSDIDLDKKLITVNKSVEFRGNTPVVKVGGKTVNADRKVSIPPVLCDFLAEYMSNMEEAKGLVCKNCRGKMHTKSSWRKMWDSFILDLNIKYGYNSEVVKHNPKRKTSELPLRISRITPHYLRHTFATMLYLQGVSEVSAKQMLGHADIQTTINIYTDLKNFNRSDLSAEYKKMLQTDYAIDWKL